MNHESETVSVDILMVEDNPGDVHLVREALSGRTIDYTLNVVMDGEQAVEYLHHQGKYVDSPRPDLVLLDLNLPRRSGHEVLADIKKDPSLRRIPVIVLTSSKAQEDIAVSYDLQVNSYVTKPSDLDQFEHVVRSIELFWLSICELPPRDS